MADFCTSDILTLASEIYESLDSPSAQSVGYVSGWLTSPSTIGVINNRLTTCFQVTGEQPCIAGGFGAAEAGILTLIYQSEYYRRMQHQALAGGSSWTSLKEGDSAISRESSSKTSAAYRDLKRDVEEELSVAVANWKLGKSIVRSVDSEVAASWPSP